MVKHLTRAAFGLLLIAGLTGCISIESGGPVQSYPVTQGPAGQSHPYLQIIAPPPGNGWTPKQIVEGFLTASAAFGDQLKTAREYLTPAESLKWNPAWSAYVYSNGPNVGAVSGGGRRAVAASVTVTGRLQETLTSDGRYVVPSASASDVLSTTFDLVKWQGQWRIANPPQELLLTSATFQRDYQLRNLYFFDPAGNNLVPDPVYVPLQATAVDLMDELVRDLISPPRDWLTRGATATAFPPGTSLVGDVTLGGQNAAVNVRGTAISKAASGQASGQVLQQVSAQLLWTLSGSGQGGPSVTSIELSVNGKPWSPQGTDENPVQEKVVYSPPVGAGTTFYYLDQAGNVLERNGTGGTPKRVAHIGTGYSQIAVSPDGLYLAALRGTALYTGPVNGKLTLRGTGYTTMSWDPSDDLWTTTADQIVMLPGSTTPDEPLGAPIAVNVVNNDGSPVTGPFTAVRVAPDGVRVAVIVGQTELNFGAIVIQPGARPTRPIVKIQFSPFYVAAPIGTFSAVTWYGADNVIALSVPDPVLTEYPVNGGGSTTIQPPAGIQSFTASGAATIASGGALIAGLAKGVMMADSSTTGAWMPIDNGSSAAFGSSPVYPG